MSKTVLICRRLFDGLSDRLTGPAEILIENGVIADVAQAVGRPSSTTVIDLADRTVLPGFTDTHVHLCLDAGRIYRHEAFDVFQSLRHCGQCRWNHPRHSDWET